MKIKRQICFMHLTNLIGLLLANGISGDDEPLEQAVCDQLRCKRIDELFTMTKLNDGYNYVTRIPKGSMNVIVKQMAISSNLLALKANDDHFIINGNYRPSEDGIYEYNEDEFDYNREMSLITAEGPLRNSIVVLILANTLNSGIHYSYTIVSTNQSNSSEEVEYKFVWKLLGFGPCSRSCGPGVQAPIFKCILNIDDGRKQRFYSPQFCEQLEKPEFTEDIYYCSRGLCPAFWQVEDDGFCECTVGDPLLNGINRRQVHCVQEQATGKIEMVAESNCPLETMPARNQRCNCYSSNEKIKIISIENQNKNDDNRIRESYRFDGKSLSLLASVPLSLRRFYRHNHSDKSGVWLMSDWTDCCGTNYEYRTIYCDRTAPFSDLCDVRIMPDQRRPCTHHVIDKTQAIWLTSSWGNCSGPCNNLKRRRTVVCFRNNILVSDQECNGTQKPLVEEICLRNHSDSLLEICGPKWHYSDWSECSRFCGGGVQRRYAKCLEFAEHNENQLIESHKCPYKTREPVYGMCHVQNCEDLLPEHEKNLKKSLNSDQNTLMLEEPKEKLVIASLPNNFRNCNDQYHMCKRLRRETSCKLDYFKIHCCLTCYHYY